MLIKKLDQVNISASSSSSAAASSSSEPKGDLQADWTSLLEKLSKSNDTTEISKLLVTFGVNHK
jgi:hypothetical protein